MQTQLMDQELDKFIGQSSVSAMNIIHNYLVAEELRGPMRKLGWMVESLLPDVLDNLQKNQKFFSPHLFSSQWEVLKSDFSLDHVALFDIHGNVVGQETFSAIYGEESLEKNMAEFRDMIVQQKIMAETFGIDKTPHALVAEMIFPLRNRHGEIIGYLSAIRSLDNQFFEKVHQLTGLHVLIFRGKKPVFSTLPAKVGEQLMVSPRIQEKALHEDGIPDIDGIHAIAGIPAIEGKPAWELCWELCRKIRWKNRWKNVRIGIASGFCSLVVNTRPFPFLLRIFEVKP